MKKNKQSEKKSATILEVKQKNTKKHQKILNNKSIQTYSNKTYLEQNKLPNSYFNPSIEPFDFIAVEMQTIKLAEEQFEKIQSTISSKNKISFCENIAALSESEFTKCKKIISDIATATNEASLVSLIQEISRNSKEILQIVRLLKSTIDSFDSEFGKSSDYDNFVFYITSPKIKSFTIDIIKNIIETKCNEIITLFLKKEAREGQKKQQNISR